MKSTVRQLFPNHNPRRALSTMARSSAMLAVALTAAACGSSSSDPITTSDGGGGSAMAEGGGGFTDVGTIVATGGGCTAPHSLCIDMTIPDTLDAQPVRLLFELFDAPGTPTHPPNGFAGIFSAPAFTAGQSLHFELTDANLQGPFWLFAIMYMPGGGYGAPVVGVDYITHSAPPKVVLDGTPINIATPLVIGR